MPRDSQGNYSLPPGTLVNSGDTILVSQHNPAMSDIASSISNSLDRNGSGGMRSNLSMNGFRAVGLADGVNSNDAATVGQLSTASVPVGVVLDWAGANAPAGFLLCYGQAISRTTYSDLFGVLGTTYGSGNGSTTFNVPDLRGRVSAGKDNMGGTSANRMSSFSGTTLGGASGNQNHTLTVAQMPSHNHGGSTGGGGEHVHGTAGTSAASNGTAEVRAAAFGGGNTQLPMNYNRATDIAGAHTHSISSQGGGDAHPNVQPTMILNKIIKAIL